ncbi:MAG: ribonuclease P protein component [Oscillospiraceae bacterium]|nr:ribonuclease P protein component [Oscillospiraceae bacterium]
MQNSARNPAEAGISRRVNAPAASLRKDSEFRRVYRKGQSKATPRLVLYVMKRYTAVGRGKSRPYTGAGVRVGVTVSAKVGNAVVRNKIRRRVKEICRLNLVKLKPGFDLVIVARDKAAASGYQELERDLVYLFDKLGMIKAET